MLSQLRNVASFINSLQRFIYYKEQKRKLFIHSFIEQIQKLSDIFLFYFFLVFYEKVDNSGLLIWKPLKFWGLLHLSISNTASSLRFYTGLKLMAYTGFYWVIETVSQISIQVISTD